MNCDIAGGKGGTSSKEGGEQALVLNRDGGMAAKS